MTNFTTPAGFVDIRNLNRAQRRALAKNEKKLFAANFTDELTPIEPGSPFFPYTSAKDALLKVYQSRKFRVRIWDEAAHPTVKCRISIERIDYAGGQRQQDGISWDELQDIKNKVGFADYCAVEVFPPENRVINLANARHLWVLHEYPDCME